MREGSFLNLKFLRALLLFFCLLESHCKSIETVPDVRIHRLQMAEMETNLFPDVASPSSALDPFVPLLAPSPLTPFTNSSVPALSGLCSFNFSMVNSMIRLTAIDCWASFAPFLANVICCPQLQATLTILIGQSSKDTGMLALDMSHSNYCLSDVQKILVSQGANENLQQICSLSLSNLTEASLCPINDLNGFEAAVNTSKLLAACGKVDPVKECCTQVCQNALSEAAERISLKDGVLSPNVAHMLPSHIDDCRSVVLRWLASRLDPSSANQVLRSISNCNVNKACPLIFPTTRNVSNACGNGLSNKTACCKTMENYISRLQRQSFITNLQALDCAALLGALLQKVNISENIYNLCHITLKDFSLQVGSQESGCLLPSLPSDATFDQSSGIGFTCDLNDNIAAPWPSSSQVSISSCNKSFCLLCKVRMHRKQKVTMRILEYLSFISLARVESRKQEGVLLPLLGHQEPKCRDQHGLTVEGRVVLVAEG